MNISHIHARQIIDSRGNPTVEADVTLDTGIRGRAAVPSGASTGTHEAVELRDDDPSLFGGKSVLKAVANVNNTIAPTLIGKDPSNQSEIDQIMLDLDGTPNKGKLGANAILAVSLAAAHAASTAQQKPLYQYFHELTKTSTPYSLPVPLMNIINGGKHAAGSTDIQEFMIMPVGAKNFSHAIQMGCEIFHALAKVLTKQGYGTTVGDEGGFAPAVKNGNKEALDLIAQAISNTSYTLGEDVVLALDVAASELYTDGKYHLKTEGKELSSSEMASWLASLTEQYPLYSVEDGLAEDDWDGWKELTQNIGNTTQLVGDDLLVTNISFLQRGIDEKAANAILIKLNQIGTLTETIQAVQLAHTNNWNAIISHRSGETEDTTIAHLVVGMATGQIKTGSLSRTDRTAKYNELLRIEESLGKDAQFTQLKK